MKIHIHPLNDSDRKPLFTDPEKVGFCRHFTDRMFVMSYSEEKGWHSPEIKKFGPFSLSPSTMVFHYSQEIFEGLKAFHSKNGKVNLFRPEMNARRFNKSASRLCMPTIPEDTFLEIIETMVTLEARWVPEHQCSALYIRPFMFGSDQVLGVRSSSTYLFSVILSPVGPYFPEGFSLVGLYVSEEFARTTKGGVGEAKTGGNYAASLLAGRIARDQGCAQVLWLDGAQRRYVEEVGAMNIFFALGDTLITPKLNGSILPGVIRDSILTLAPYLGYKVEEQEITIDEILAGIQNGSVTEIFGSGTAASISPVGKLKYKGKDYLVKSQSVGPISQKLYDTLLAIQYGEIDDPFNWIRTINIRERALRLSESSS